MELRAWVGEEGGRPFNKSCVGYKNNLSEKQASSLVCRVTPGSQPPSITKLWLGGCGAHPRDSRCGIFYYHLSKCSDKKRHHFLVLKFEAKIRRSTMNSLPRGCWKAGGGTHVLSILQSRPESTLRFCPCPWDASAHVYLAVP